MLSGSAILRVLLLIVAAAGLAWIVQSLWLHAPEPGATVPANGTATSGRPAEGAAAPPAPEPVRVVRPAEPVREPARSAEVPPPPASAPPVEPTPSPTPAPVAQTPPPPAPDPVAEAEENAPAAAVALVDLNTASLADLNGLKGGGAIGRTIIQHRPYASIDQLLSKRVLNRATYQRIKDQVTVR
jgi:outer membrane biosynthesis protein TonB